MSFDITGMDIKKIYKYLIGDWDNPVGDRQPEVRGWYKNYLHWRDEVKRHKGKDLDAVKDRDFFELLFIKEPHGISQPGQGRITPNEFEEIIKSDEVLSALKELILGIDDANKSRVKKEFLIENFFNALRKCTGENNNLIVNRIIGACTEDVSSTAALEAFDSVFDFFTTKKKLIGSYSSPNIVCSTENRPVIDWYNKNLHLMNELRKKFNAEIENENCDIDVTKLSIFFWEFNEYNIKDLDLKYSKGDRSVICCRSGGD